MKQTAAFDIEIYQDYFLVAFMNAATGRVRHFEMYEGQPLDVEPLRSIVRSYRLVSFNGMNFDLPLLTLALLGKSCGEIKQAANAIIKNNLPHWKLGIEPIVADHIDLIEVLPGIGSLKIYGGRIHQPTLQDLPIEPDALIEPDQRGPLRLYCENDLRVTLALFKALAPQLELRTQMSADYGIDLRSKSDAQIAEAVIKRQVESALGRRLKKPDPRSLAGEVFHYTAPTFVGFETENLKSVLATVTNAAFEIADSGVVQLPKEIGSLKVKIGASTYQMGIGGLHSCEKSIAHQADDDFVLTERDVTSFYPSIILACGLSPELMGEYFTPVYRSIVERRLAAKKSGDKVQADALKITINGSFGKLGSPYSALYSPKLLVQTTVTGQLSLLMLIEMLESEGFAVLSANTDGVLIRASKRRLALLDFVIWEWEHRTGLQTESTEYRAIFCRDVNNYVAITPGSYKSKGAFARSGLSKNPSNEIVSRAVIAYLGHGTAIEDTINQCRDITQFVSLRTVRGGATKDGENLGRAVRWYYAKGAQGVIRYRVNNYTVPKTEGARPLMVLPDELPADLDFDRYVHEAQSALIDLGAIDAETLEPLWPPLSAMAA